METCPWCGSTDLIENETDVNCDGCSVMECEDCEEVFERAEMIGIEHECKDDS